MLELLAPAGSPEAVIAAVQNGANAVYLGYGAFNARRNAKNFSPEELAAAVSYCHIRGVKVYLTLNTLAADRELAACAQLAAEACERGVDAVLVQDLGLARVLRQTLPALELHGSTQMCIHSLDGAKFCADLGMKRVVLARELSRDAIEYITTHSPIETEVFVHGALCMCYSGQCLMSGVIGGRSGNRGLCAQPCRMAYGWGNRPDGHPLSLKDLSLAAHLQTLRKIGVACLKIEGRMKRPEYVAVVTGIYSRLLNEGRGPTDEETLQLESAFSRGGFTDGYFRGETGPAMFGTRPEGTKDPEAFFAKVRAEYGEERPLVPVKLYALVRADEPIQAAAADDRGNICTAAGKAPEPAHTKELTRELVEDQLAKTGGTPYLCQKASALVEPGLSAPLSALNALRREALTALTVARSAVPARQMQPFQPGVRYENPTDPPILVLSLSRVDQLSLELTRLLPARVCLPAHEIAAHPDAVRDAMRRGMALAVTLPRIVWDSETETLSEQMTTARALGIDEALVGAWGLAERARAMGFALRADYPLWVYNSQTLKELRRLGFLSATVSPELRLAQIRDLSKALPCELLVYGRLPLMITEHCVIKNRSGQCTCQNVNRLIDRTGAAFPVLPAPGCRSEILNGKKLYLGDRQKDYNAVGLSAARLHFTTENALECVRVTEAYLQKGNWEPTEYTRGLYYREVE